MCDAGRVRPPLTLVAEPGALCCPPLGDRPQLTATEAIEVSWRLKALSDPARVSIVSLLAGRDDHELTTRELAPLIGLTEATVSHHLKQLAEAGLVSRKRSGARVLYCLDVGAIRAVAGVLDVCCDCSSTPDERRPTP